MVTVSSRMRRVVLSAMVMLASTAGSAAAQHNVLPDTGGRVYGLVGGGFGDGTFVATGAGAGLRLTPHLGVDLELTHLSGSGRTEEVAAADPFPGISVFSTTNAAFDDYSFLDHGADDLFPSIRFEHHGRDVTTLLTKLTVEFPVASGFLFPYLTGGGGVGRVSERHSIAVDVDPFPLIPLDKNQSTVADDAVSCAGSCLHFSDVGVYGPLASSEIGLALVLGGGVDVRLWRGFGVGVDIRWLRVLRAYGALDTAQATARASYRF